MDDTKNQFDTTPPDLPTNPLARDSVPLSRAGGEKIVQPSAAFQQEQQVEQAQEQAWRKSHVDTPSIYPEPSAGQLRSEPSTDQLDAPANPTKKPGNNARKILKYTLAGLVIIGISTILIVTTIN